MFDFGDTLALTLGLVISAIIMLACLGLYARKRTYSEQL